MCYGKLTPYSYFLLRFTEKLKGFYMALEFVCDKPLRAMVSTRGCDTKNLIKKCAQVERIIAKSFRLSKLGFVYGF